MTTPPQESYPTYPDEIDLFQLCADLWRKRALILLCTLAVLACGVGYAYWAPEVYKAEARLLPPPVHSLSPLAVATGVSPDEAYALTQQYLGAVGLKKELLDSPVFAGYIDKAFPEATELEKLDELSKLMSVSLPNVKQNKSLVVSIQWQDPGQAAELVNAWVGIAMQHAKDDLSRNAGVLLQRKISALERQINVKKQLALRQLDSELSKLQDAKVIADEIGLIKPSELSTGRVMAGIQDSINVMSLRSLYLLGSEALSAEIDALERRRGSAGDYVAGLVSLEEKLAELQSITIDSELVKTAKIDAAALPPEKRIKPKRMLVILGSLVLGAMVGMFVALVQVSLERRKTVSLRE